MSQPDRQPVHPGATALADRICQRLYFRGTGHAAVVQLMIIYFIVFGRLLKGIFPFSLMEDYQIAGVAFGLNSAAYVAEIIRAGIMAVDQGTNRSRPFPGAVG